MQEWFKLKINILLWILVAYKPQKVKEKTQEVNNQNYDGQYDKGKKILWFNS
jgi:hypothetical protein